MRHEISKVTKRTITIQAAPISPHQHTALEERAGEWLTKHLDPDCITASLLPVSFCSSMSRGTRERWEEVPGPFWVKPYTHGEG